MDLIEAMKARHSVRQYTDKPLGKEIIEELQREYGIGQNIARDE